MKSEPRKEHATLGCYHLGATMGRGAYAKVKVARCDFTKRDYAIKIFNKKQCDFSIELLRREVQNLKLIKHNNVPLFIEFYESVLYVKKNGQKYEVAAIVMEHVQNGDIFDYLLASEKGLPENVARTLFRSLIETMEDIHNQGIAHRDLKPENLLLDKDFNLKIGDFGYAAKFIDMKGRCGTPAYMAPEIWSEDFYNGASADVFSCGAILFLLMTGFQPFSIAKKSEDALYDALATRDYERFWENFEESEYNTFSDEFKDLIHDMLDIHPNRRARIQQIQEHPWFQGPVLNTEEMKEALGGLKEKVDIIREENRQKEKEKCAKAKALLKEMKEANICAPYAFMNMRFRK